MARLSEDGGRLTDPLDPEVDVAETPDADLGVEPDLDEPEEEEGDGDDSIGE